jgi:hypothetical protein
MLWGQSWFLKPLLEATGIFCLVLIIRSQNNSELKRLSKSYISAVLALFMLTDLSFLLYYPSHKIEYTQYLRSSELVNLIFALFELSIICSIFNLDLKSKLLRKIKLFSVVIATITNCFFSLVVISKDTYEIRIFGEIQTFLCFALLTINSLAYFYVLVKRNIYRTYAMPTNMILFCYIILSLLIFPCASYLSISHIKLGYWIGNYHMFLLILIFVVMTFNIRVYKKVSLDYIEFQI